MSARMERTIRPALMLLIAAGLVAAGALGTYWFMRRPAPEVAAPAQAVTAAPSTALRAVAITLSKEAIERAGIVVARVEALQSGGGVRVPAVVEPNAYRSVVVTPLVAGRVTSVSAELGQQVKRGQTLAQIYSPELADAQSRYLATRAELDAHERELRRTERLVELGSASRQELERVHAEHTAAVTMLSSLQSRLMLLGMTPAQIEKLSGASAVAAAVSVPAPIDGVVTARAANAGVNVDPSAPLFSVVDLSTVWLVGNLYERDLARVRVGSRATVTTTAYPELRLEGTVSYIDPEINPQTRTARVRVEVPNPGRQLRLGMYAEMQIGRVEESKESAESRESRVAVPREAVQIVGNRSVVYLADEKEAGRFVEREVQLGAASGDSVEVTRGVQSGELVVVKGSFALRAERFIQ